MISYEENINKFNFRVGGIIESPDNKSHNIIIIM